ncbi:MAG TPA: hypothetical protein PK954_08595 [Anaerolineales bacterium]|nr:hypothetical protein [Anaerolineales bacterium]HRF48520.1 hypothetical protein [Anaerolineales bacterium]
MTHFSCPNCGALLPKDSAECAVCHAAIHWEGRRPSLALPGPTAHRIWALAILVLGVGLMAFTALALFR